MNVKREPIDGVFVTKGTAALNAGYLPFGERGKLDHRALWIEVDSKELLGMSPPEIKKISQEINMCNTKFNFQTQ